MLLNKKKHKAVIRIIKRLKWRPLKDFPNYAVSEYGDIINITNNNLLISYNNKDGYQRYKLRDKDGNRKQPMAHILVCQAFNNTDYTENYKT